MAKFTSIIIASATLLAGVQAACPANAHLCGSELINRYQCSTGISLTFITPAGNNPADCIFPISAAGDPQGAGVVCCSPGHCIPNGSNAFCS